MASSKDSSGIAARRCHWLDWSFVTPSCASVGNWSSTFDWFPFENWSFVLDWFFGRPPFDSSCDRNNSPIRRSARSRIPSRQSADGHGFAFGALGLAGLLTLGRRRRIQYDDRHFARRLGIKPPALPPAPTPR